MPEPRAALSAAFRCHEFTAVEMQPGAGGANLELGEGVPTGAVVAGGEGVGVEGVFREEAVRRNPGVGAGCLTSEKARAGWAACPGGRDDCGRRRRKTRNKGL